jgi:molecular chaperone GrpE
MKDEKNTKGVKKSSTVKKEESKKIEELREMVQDLALTVDRVEDEKQVVTNQLKKALADYHNLEANTQKRLNILYKNSRKELALQLIPVVDDLTMAIKSRETLEFNEQTKSWANGIVEILNNIEKALEGIGLEKYIPEKNSKFDPDIHEALSVVQGEEGGLIYDVIQPGYILDDTVIRPSRVVVTK